MPQIGQAPGSERMISGCLSTAAGELVLLCRKPESTG
jgi:hypothetical protein